MSTPIAQAIDTVEQAKAGLEQGRSQVETTLTQVQQALHQQLEALDAAIALRCTGKIDEAIQTAVQALAAACEEASTMLDQERAKLESVLSLM